MTDNGSEERDPPNPAPVVFASDWERDLWREVYVLTAAADPGGTVLDAHLYADDAVRDVQARAHASQRPALERLKAKFEAELKAARDSGSDYESPACHKELRRQVAIIVWRSAAKMVAEALESE